MKKNILITLFTIIILFTLTACGSKESSEESLNKNNSTPQEQNNNVNASTPTPLPTSNTQEESKYTYNDDEIIDLDIENNEPYKEEKVVVEKVINCDGCVYSYFSDDKSFGTELSENEFTTDITTLKTMGGKQRHNFFGFILSDNKIARAFSCILKDNKIYCIEGSVDGSHHASNIGILNQIFTPDQCKYISDGHTYVCTDGNYNGDTITTGYASLHYETSCTIFGSEGKTGKMSCN